MPIYTFYNKRTKKEFDEMMTIAEMEKYLSKNKHINQVIKGLNIVSSVGNRTGKTDSGWKENLSRIAEAHPRSALAKRYGKKSIKQIKTEQVIKKHNVSPSLIAKQNDLENFINNPEHNEITKGWKLEVFGEKAIKLMNGDIALTIKNQQLEFISV